MGEAYIVAIARTAGGRKGGRLKDWHPVDMAAKIIDALVEKTKADPALIDDVIMGCVGQAGEQAMNIARNAVMASSLPESVPATTVDRQCGSSQQAVHFAAQAGMSGTQDLIVAGGVQTMNQIPITAAMLAGQPYGHKDPFSGSKGWIARYGRGGGPGWTPDLTGRRLIRWINHAILLLNGRDKVQARSYFRSLGRQTIFLARRWKAATPGLPRFEALTGLIYAGLSLTGMERHVAGAASALARECAREVEPDGGILTRNPEELLRVFTLLTWAARALTDAGRKPLPDHVTTNGHQANLDQFRAMANGRSIRQTMASFNAVDYSVELVGTPDAVAARMGEVMQEVGGDGYLFAMPNVNRRTLAEIEDGLVPALQDRGLVRTTYEHAQFRDNLLAF